VDCLWPAHFCVRLCGVTFVDGLQTKVEGHLLKVIVFLSSLYAETSSPSLFVVLSSSRGKWSLRSDVAKGGSGSLVATQT